MIHGTADTIHLTPTDMVITMDTMMDTGPVITMDTMTDIMETTIPIIITAMITTVIMVQEEVRAATVLALPVVKFCRTQIFRRKISDCTTRRSYSVNAFKGVKANDANDLSRPSGKTILFNRKKIRQLSDVRKSAMTKINKATLVRLLFHPKEMDHRI